MLIKNYELSDELIVEIGKFAVLWNLFENYYCNCNCSSKTIYNISSSISISDESQAKFAEALNKRRHLFGQDFIDYITNNLYSEDRQPKKDEINNIEIFLKQEKVEAIAGCLLSIFRIRNNMMHGLKDVSQLDNQLELFKSANEVLESLEWR